MKICKKYVKSLFVSIIICLPCFSFASWKDSACNITNKNCLSVSDNYNQPYCITNVNRSRTDGDVDNVNSCVRPILTNNLSNISSEITTRELVKQYCDSLFWELSDWRVYFAKSSSNSEDFDWQQTFDSHQSLFLYALCSSFDDERWKKSLVKGVYKWDITKLLNLQQKSKWKDLCSLKDYPDLDSCDLSIYVTKIFEWIMSDLFKIKYAQVLYVNANENFDAKKKVEEFMEGYFKINESYKDLKKDYSKTISALESDQKYYKGVLNSLKIIDNSKLLGCPAGWKIKWMNFVSCALHSFKWSGLSLTPPFVTLVYNELLHYRNFVSYYSYAMQNRANGGESEARALDLLRYSNMQVEAFKLVQNNFEEFSMTYPLHIWVLLYIEKAEKFRNNSLSKVVPLFYSLSEKLQNVQEPTS